jgi:hypothetical protein
LRGEDRRRIPELREQPSPGGALATRREQPRDLPAAAGEPSVEGGVALGAPQQARETGGVAGLEVSGIIGAEEADRSRDPAGEHGHARGGGFGDHVRPAFHARREDEQARTREAGERLAPWPFPEPAIAGVSPVLGARAALERRSHRLAEMNDPDS